MPIVIPKDIPAYKVLTDENIFVMTHKRAITQDIRPIEVIPGTGAEIDLSGMLGGIFPQAQEEEEDERKTGARDTDKR